MVRQARHERAFSRRRRRESCSRRYRAPCRRASADSCIRATPGPFMLRQAQHERGFAPGAHLRDLFGVRLKTSEIPRIWGQSKNHPKCPVRVFTLTPNSRSCFDKLSTNGGWVLSAGFSLAHRCSAKVCVSRSPRYRSRLRLSKGGARARLRVPNRDVSSTHPDSTVCPRLEPSPHVVVPITGGNRDNGRLNGDPVGPLAT